MKSDVRDVWKATSESLKAIETTSGYGRFATNKNERVMNQLDDTEVNCSTSHNNKQLQFEETKCSTSCLPCNKDMPLEVLDLCFQ